MIRLRTATGAIGWMDVNDRDAAAMVASGRWVLADSLDYSRTKHGEIRPVAPDVEAEVKRGPGRPRKAE